MLLGSIRRSSGEECEEALRVAGKRRRSKSGRHTRIASDGAPPKRRASRKKRLIITLISIILLLTIAGAAVYFYFFDGKILQDWLNLSALNPVKAPGRVATCPLDGSVVKDENLIKRRALIVKVENLTEARPQSGLEQADIVIESMAEGGITRFAVIYLCRDAEEIGPVRSARQQDITFIHEYDALFAHVGGSDAWSRDKDGGIADLDEFTFGDAYWRDEDKDAPHNVYTATARLHKAAQEEELEKAASLDSWPFKADRPAKKGQGGTTVSVEISYGADCDARYDYDYATNTYLRFVAGEPFTDAVSGKQLAPKNVVVMNVNYYSSDDGEEYGLGGSDIMELVGEGKAVVLRDGVAIEGRWVKASASGRTMFLDAEGRPIDFNRGQVWLEIIPSSWEITLTAGETPQP